MDKPFLSAYSRLLIKTCHKRGAFAMGGMAAFIPSKDVERNNQVLAKVKADKALEANNGHDGTWIAHHGLADTAMAVFNGYWASTKISCSLPVMKMRRLPLNSYWSHVKANAQKRECAPIFAWQCSTLKRGSPAMAVYRFTV